MSTRLPGEGVDSLEVRRRKVLVSGTFHHLLEGVLISDLLPLLLTELLLHLHTGAGGEAPLLCFVTSEDALGGSSWTRPRLRASLSSLLPLPPLPPSPPWSSVGRTVYTVSALYQMKMEYFLLIWRTACPALATLPAHSRQASVQAWD